MAAASTQSITMLAMTKSSLNTWLPYTIRYPSPARETRYSPTMTPTQLMPTLILRALMIVGTDAGSTTIVSICSLVAPSVLMRSCFSPVISSKPASTVITVTTRDISRPIMIMLLTAKNKTIRQIEKDRKRLNKSKELKSG